MSILGEAPRSTPITEIAIGGRVDRLVRWKVSIDVRAFGEWRGEDGIKLGELAFKLVDTPK